jgi:triacylglycerol lipase
MKIKLALMGVATLLLTALGQSTADASVSASSGWNDWACQPSSAHPEPVVLVHGLGASGQANWFYHAPRLVEAGYCVYSLDYGVGSFGAGGVASMRDSAAELGRFVDRVLAATGAEEVSIVGHSEGTTVPAYYLKFLGGAEKVRNFVGFGANYKGTTLGGLDTLARTLLQVLPGADALFQRECAACLEFLPGSAFLDDLNAGGVSVPGVRYTNIVSRYDGVVRPYTSGIMNEPGVHDVVLQDVCGGYDYSGHLSQAVDPNVASLILNGLDPANARPIACRFLFLPL